MRVDPAPTDAALTGYYRAYADHMRAGGRSARGEAEVCARADADVADLERWRAPGRLLDVGCGGGHLLRAAQRRGWDVFGTEVGEHAVAALRAEFGSHRIWHAHAGADDVISGMRFDAVVMRHVLEHVRDPTAALRQVRAMLGPGGIMLCEVPDVSALRIRLRRRPLMGQLHLWHFSAATLAALLVRQEFGVNEICFRDHRGPVGPTWRRLARRLRFGLENAAWRWARVDLGTNVRIYATPLTY